MRVTLLRCAGAGCDGREATCRELFRVLFVLWVLFVVRPLFVLRCASNLRALLVGVRATLELPFARFGLFCEWAKALSRPALRFWVARLLVAVRPRLPFVRDALTFLVAAPRPENSPGRAVAATAGRP